MSFVSSRTRVTSSIPSGRFAVQEFLESTDVVDWHHPVIREQADSLQVSDRPIDTARRCFEFVRDTIRHSRDFEMNPATCRASDVLIYGTGYCYAKSHLLAALLRANGIPAGFCYQRLSVGDHGSPYSLHGYNAVYLPTYGWYRVDARGNKARVDARFDPPREHLGFSLKSPDEFDFEEILAEPLSCVVESLRKCDGWQSVLENLPDVQPADFSTLGLSVRNRTASNFDKSN